MLWSLFSGDHVMRLLFGLSLRVNKLEVKSTKQDRDSELLSHVNERFTETNALTTEKRCESKWTTDTTIRSFVPLTV